MGAAECLLSRGARGPGQHAVVQHSNPCPVLRPAAAGTGMSIRASIEASYTTGLPDHPAAKSLANPARCICNTRNATKRQTNGPTFLTET